MAEQRQGNPSGNVVPMSPRSDVDALLQAVEEHIDRLKREKTELQGTVASLTETARDLQSEINRMKGRLRRLICAPDTLDASTKQGTEAIWPWEAPMPVPKHMQGVYRLMRQGKTIYIGQSVNIMSRVFSHMAEKDFDQFSYALVDGGREALNEVESALIIIERPPANHGTDGRLRHPTGHQWTREEAQAVLDKYQRGAAADAEEAAA